MWWHQYAKVIVFCLMLLLTQSGSMVSASSVGVRLSIEPLECTIEVVNDGLSSQMRLTPAACQQALENSYITLPDGIPTASFSN